MLLSTHRGGWSTSLKLVFLFSVLTFAVNVSHEQKQASSCPWGCKCQTMTSEAMAAAGFDTTGAEDGGGANILLNCSGRNFTQPPIPIVDSTASKLLLTHNTITHVDLVFLKHYPSLRVLNLGSNGLRSLSKSIDAPIFSLTHMDLSGNHLHVLHDYVLSGFPSLKTLNLSGNDLHTVTANALSLPALETLDLSKNKLPIIGSHLFETSPRLNEIDLSRNGFSRLNDGTFGHLTHLNLLDLSHNSLMRVEDNVFVGMNISHLDLGYNNFRKVPSLPLRKLTAAKTLVLDGNPLNILGKAGVYHVLKK